MDVERLQARNGRRRRSSLAARIVGAVAAVQDSEASSRFRTLVPGSAFGCWRKDFTYERCCLRSDDTCWYVKHDGAFVESTGFTRDMCCSGFLEAAQRELFDVPTYRVTEILPGARTDLAKCLRRKRTNASLAQLLKPRDSDVLPTGMPHFARALEAQLRWSFASTDTLCENPFVKATECIASLHDVDVALDLFLGGGCTTFAMAFGLGIARQPPGSINREHRHVWRPRARPPAVYSFEKNQTTLSRAISAGGRLGDGSRLGWWRIQAVQLESRGDLMSWQTSFVHESEDADSEQSHTMSDRVETVGGVPTLQAARPEVGVFALAGEPYPLDVAHNFYNVPRAASRWNPIDVLCQNNEPVDMVLIDLEAGDESWERVWSIIEVVCRPRWVLLINLNIRSEASWVYHRLRSLRVWRLEVQGHFSLFRDVWFAHTELRRVRAWAIFSRTAT